MITLTSAIVLLSSALTVNFSPLRVFTASCMLPCNICIVYYKGIYSWNMLWLFVGRLSFVQQQKEARKQAAFAWIINHHHPSSVVFFSHCFSKYQVCTDKRRIIWIQSDSMLFRYFNWILHASIMDCGGRIIIRSRIVLTIFVNIRFHRDSDSYLELWQEMKEFIFAMGGI
jgi:hypothetical protein